MKKVLLFGILCIGFVSHSFAAVNSNSKTKSIKIKNLVVERQKRVSFRGNKGIIVKFKGVKKEVFLPLEKNNKKKSILEALNESEIDSKPLRIKMVRAGRDIIQYKGDKGSEILALGKECRRTKNTKNPKMFCNRGYIIESVEIAKGETEFLAEEVK